ncbi:MAG: sensor histidine kinase, partial [Bacteriovoracia bacterium]
MRVNNALEKLGAPDYDLFLFNKDGVCVYANSRSGQSSCKNSEMMKENFLGYESELKLATTVIGRMKVNVQDRFQFHTGNLLDLAFDNFGPIFAIMAILWGSWVFFSNRKILTPYYRKMLAMEKDKASFDTIRQIIHDTKGEIASLDLLSYEIEDADKADEMRTILDKIRRTFDNLHQVKDSILSAKKESLHEVFNLVADIENHALTKHKHLSNLDLEFKVSGITNEVVRLDPTLLERVVSNLIENSVTAPCEKETRKIRVTSILGDKEVIFQVEDNCEGISKENTSKIFEKGFTTKSDGTGQGLAFVKTQVESWSGHISIKSEIGIGTTVTFSIPLAQRPKFIILDDDKYLLLRYQKMLQKSGNVAEVYNSPESLFDDAQSISPESIFLLDYDLGVDMVGTDVALKLSKMGMKNLYLHTGNPMTDEMDYPFLKGILTKGNFAETMKTLKV